MRKCKIAVFIAAFIVSVAAASFAQSLGDVAREQRQKQAAKDAQKPRKVITDDDIQEHPDPQETDAKQKRAHSDVSLSALSNEKNGDRVKTAILAQKNRIKEAQSYADKLKASTHFVDSNLYYNGPQYNQAQARKLQEVERLQQRVKQEQQRLEEMQEVARKAGFGSSVYDP